MKPFAFVGKLASSKSILNRLLLAQSYQPGLEIVGDSDCDDVHFMQNGLAELFTGKGLEVGAAATVLRFLALRVSRIPGRHRLVGHTRLFSRPQQELTKLFNQLGVQCEFSQDALQIESAGWKMHGDTLLVPTERSSQFASAVLLNAWELPFDLYVSLGGGGVSEGYWRMSVQIAQQLGMKIDFWDRDFRIPKMQKCLAGKVSAEIDMGSAFALSAIAAVSGRATILEFPEKSLQPDAQFVTILQTMGVPITWSNHSLKVEKAPRLGGVAVNLKSSPDLFPVLAALCALSEGESDLFGAPHLAHKESDRIQQMAGLIRRLGRTVEEKADGLFIRGPKVIPSEKVIFDCDQDHRLAFAAAVLRAGGLPIEIVHGEVVSKSFPGFWEILGWDL